MEEKTDLRIRKTYKALCDAFVNILEKKRFDDLTVNELCDEAMIRRATFYKHFADKYDFFFFFYPPKAGPVHLTGKRGNSPQRNLCLHALP